ncbi:hypothetical protein F5Y18DRAFT_1819 [Xylariaceae sp. FL1019]|nr:hypothetical protein F5Y18DRAFT_1819 [Xylariaceae sp. FL1019]
MMLRRLATMTAPAAWAALTTRPLPQTPLFNAASRVANPRQVLWKYHSRPRKTVAQHEPRKSSRRRNPQNDGDPSSKPGLTEWIRPFSLCGILEIIIDNYTEKNLKARIREKLEKIAKTTRKFEKQYVSAKVNSWDKEPLMALTYFDYARAVLHLHHEIISLQHPSLSSLGWGKEELLEDLGPLPRCPSDEADKSTNMQLTTTHWFSWVAKLIP